MLKLLISITETVWFRLSLFLLLATNLIFLLLSGKPAETLDFSLAKEAINLLDNYGYYPMLDNENLNHGMIRGIVSTYDDPYTSFFPPPDHELQMDRLAGKFGGIGINLFKNTENQFVITPYENSPASAAGILDGDILLSIDGKPAIEYGSIHEILAYFHAEEGMTVNIEVIKFDTGEIEFLSIERAEIHRPSVHAFIVHQEPKIAVLDINVIGAETPDEITGILNAFLEQGVEHFIFDLQVNYGGFLSEAVEISRLFLFSGVILREIDSDQKVTEFKANSIGKFSELDMVALVNDQTASAAEIIAGILQTYRDIPLIGNQTYGKNTIQLVFELEDTSSIHVTHAIWEIPDLPYDFEEMGLQPDIYFEPGEDFYSNSLNAAIEYFLNKNP